MINQLRQRAGVRAIVGNAFIAALAVFAAGCDLSTGEVTSNSIHQFVQVRNPVGHVQGLVTDSNGRFLNNVLVTVGSRQTTTNSGGQYEFRDLEVVNVANTSGDEEDTDHESIRISVQPQSSTCVVQTDGSCPTGTSFLAAIVEVYPEAQFNAPGEFGEADTGDTTIGGQQTVFVDGFRIQAEDAILPALNSTIEILALRDEDTGQLVPAGTSVTLDYAGTSVDAEQGDDGQTVLYGNVSWSTTVQADGSVTFTGVADESDFEMHVRRYTCDGSDDSNDEEFDDTCFLTSDNETNLVTYANYFVNLLTDGGDTVSPHVISIVSAYDFSSPSVDDTRCSAAPGATIAKLLRDEDGTAANGGFAFVTNEEIADDTVTDFSDSAVVYNYTLDDYVDVASVVVSGASITVNTSTAVAGGNEISVFLFTPDFLDLAGNAIEEAPFSAGFGVDNVDCEGDITPLAGSGTTFLALDLEMFQEPNTDVAAVTPVQEEVDPVDEGANNDLPVNQAQSVAYNDVDDGDAGGDIQQLNADNIDTNPGAIAALELRADAFGGITGVAEVGTGNIDVRQARVEFVPSAEAASYRISRNSDPDIEIVTPAEFEAADDTAASTTPDGVVDGDGDLRIQNVDRGAGTLYALVIDDTDEGDEICVEALDDLGNAGDAGCVTVADNVEPTVSIQRSYHADITTTPAGLGATVSGTEIEDDAGGDNLSGCFSHDNSHAGIALASGTSAFGEGGELTDPGSDQAVGNLCVGFGPELLRNAGGTPATVHTELEAGRDASFNVPANAAAFPRAYDGGAFTAWTRPTPIPVGFAFTEDLLSTPAPVVGSLSASLTNCVVQNNTVAGHLSAPVVEDLVSCDVDDVYDAANSGHGGTIDFTGVADLAGNVASDEANAMLTARDQWPSYLVTGTTRNASGQLVITTDFPIEVDTDAPFTTTITLDDFSGGPVTIPLIVNGAGNPVNFSQAGNTITIDPYWDDAGDPSSFATIAGYPALFEPGAANTLEFDATQHVIVDFSLLYDERGNQWADHTAVANPLFIMPDALATFVVAADDGDVAATDTTATVSWTANHEICNVSTDDGYTSGVSGDEVALDCSDATSLLGAADFVDTIAGDDDDTAECVEAVDGSITCDKDTVDAIVTVTSATCDYDPVGAGFATDDAALTVNAAHTVITITIDCDGATAFASTDTVTFTLSAATFASAWDGDVDTDSADFTVP